MGWLAGAVTRLMVLILTSVCKISHFMVISVAKLYCGEVLFLVCVASKMLVMSKHPSKIHFPKWMSSIYD